MTDNDVQEDDSVSEKKTPFRHRWYAFPLFVVLLFVVLIALSVLPDLIPEKKATAPEYEVMEMTCFKSLREKLKDPDSASYDQMRLVDQTKVGDDFKYVFEGRFRAKNSFGGYVTGYWRCNVTWTESIGSDLFIATQFLEPDELTKPGEPSGESSQPSPTATPSEAPAAEPGFEPTFDPTITLAENFERFPDFSTDSPRGGVDIELAERACLREAHTRTPEAADGDFVVTQSKLLEINPNMVGVIGEYAPSGREWGCFWSEDEIAFRWWTGR